jgi:hypothetical protein
VVLKRKIYLSAGSVKNKKMKKYAKISKSVNFLLLLLVQGGLLRYHAKRGRASDQDVDRTITSP